MQDEMKDLTILGMDPGISNFGWAIYGKNVNKSGIIKVVSPFKNVQERIAEMMEEITALVNTYEVEDIVIEKMMIRQVIPTVIQGYAARMAVLASLVPHGLMAANEYHTITTKKCLLGKAKASKKEMIDLMTECFGLKRKIEEHEADSYAQIAMYILEFNITCPVKTKLNSKGIKRILKDGK
jgi:Holliday junction resolvasome RuvABC endonuclease subunit